jgi:hypothetical protein
MTVWILLYGAPGAFRDADVFYSFVIAEDAAIEWASRSMRARDGVEVIPARGADAGAAWVYVVVRMNEDGRVEYKTKVAKIVTRNLRNL